MNEEKSLLSIKQDAFSIEFKRFIRFSIVGLINTFVDFGLYLLLTRIFDFHYLLANVSSWIVAVCFSFIMNKYWTFECYDKGAIPKQYVKFFVVNIIALGLSVLILFLFVEIFKLPDVFGKIFAIGLIAFWNFFANKHWTFRNAKRKYTN